MPSNSLYLILLTFFGASSAADAVCPNIIPRCLWGGRQPIDVAYLTTPVPYVIIHHTVTLECETSDTCSANVRSIQSYHMNNLGWNDIGYSFLIGGDGNVYDGRSWNGIGAHTLGWNNKSLAIAFIGNYQDAEPSDKMLNAARHLIDCGKSRGTLLDSVKVLGGRQVRDTISPGDKLFSRLESWPDWSPIP